jgi:hypothetical protein
MDSDATPTHQTKSHEAQPHPPYYPPHRDPQSPAKVIGQGHQETPPKPDPRPFASQPSAPPPVVVIQAAEPHPKANPSEIPGNLVASILVLVLATVAIGISCRRWLGEAEYRGKIFFCGTVAVVLLGLSYLAPIWPICLAAEIAAVALGLTAGWCRIDYERMRVTAISRVIEVKGGAELDDLGFFNARVAMKSPDLFRISIADIPMKAEERAAAQDLVDHYWQGKQSAHIPKEKPAR